MHESHECCEINSLCARVKFVIEKRWLFCNILTVHLIHGQINVSSECFPTGFQLAIHSKIKRVFTVMAFLVPQ